MDWHLPYFILAGLLVALLAATLMLARAYLSLKRAHAALVAKVAQQQNDLIGLSSAAVQVDQRMLNQERRLRCQVPQDYEPSCEKDGDETFASF